MIRFVVHLGYGGRGRRSDRHFSAGGEISRGEREGERDEGSDGPLLI